MLAPVSSIVRQGEGWAVFVVEDDAARLQPVTVGQRNDTHVQLLGGATPGQRVVVSSGDAVADGARIVVNSGPQRQ